jgi:hypothetical protein
LARLFLWSTIVSELATVYENNDKIAHSILEFLNSPKPRNPLTFHYDHSTILILRLQNGGLFPAVSGLHTSLANCVFRELKERIVHISG